MEANMSTLPFEGQTLDRMGDLSLVISSHGDSIKKPCTGQVENNLFMIYMTKINNRWRVIHLFDYGITDLAQAELNLFTIAKTPRSHPAIVGKNFRNLVWMYPSYLTFVLDIQDYLFEWTNRDPIVFVKNKPGIPGDYAPNRSFCGAIPIKVGGADAVRCSNFINDENGNPIKDPQKIVKYAMEINFLEPYDDNTPPDLHIFDPDGQNQGPPVP
jgi:hypothetical protein